MSTQESCKFTKILRENLLLFGDVVNANFNERHPGYQSANTSLVLSTYLKAYGDKF